MSDMQAIMNFELLPNEILIECFEYLNAVDIFCSFDFLNSRFCNLIRNIPLHFDVGEVEKSKLAQFGIKMLLNPEMKKQIISIKLTKDNTFDNIKTLFSFVSLNEFSHLRTLVLSNLNLTAMYRISSMLPLLANLRYFCLENSSFGSHSVVSSLPTSAIQTLSIPRIPDNLSLTHPFIALVNLTLSFCSVKELCGFFKWSPELQYLDIKDISEYDDTIFNQPQFFNDQAVRLKRLTINDFHATFDALEIILQRTPNLEFLMISADDGADIVDARRWRKLIRSSLPFLDVFKFIFSFDIEDEDSGIIDKFQQFQTNFWRHQHHWYIEYVLSKYKARIYTVPYMSYEYEITSNAKRYYNQLDNNTNAFANVTDLILSIEAMTNNDEYHFLNVKSLRLCNDRVDVNHGYPFLKIKHVQCLKIMVNLCNLTHLEVSPECRWKSSSVILQLLKEALHLSSLKINKNTLFVMLNNRELCECLNKMIKKLDIPVSWIDACLNTNEIVKICQIFSNMEEFQCHVDRSDSLKTILDELSKLSCMKTFSYKAHRWESGSRWLENHKSEVDLCSFIIRCEYLGYDSDDDMSDLDPDYLRYDIDFD